MVRGISALPPEIVAIICGLLSGPDLMNLRLLSHAWDNAVQPILFETVQLRTYLQSFERLQDIARHGVLRTHVKTISYDGRTLGGTAAQMGGFDNWLRCSAGSGLGLLPKSRDEFLSPFSTEELEAYYFKYCQHLFAQEHISRRDYAKDMLVDALKQLPKVVSVQYTSRSTDIGERVPSLSSLSHVARQTLAEPESYHGYLEKERRFWILLQSVWLSGHSRWLESVHGSDLDLKRWNDTAKSFVRCYTALPAIQRLSLEFEFAQHGDGETTQLASMVAHASSLTELRLSFDDFSFDNPHAVIHLPQVISSETRWKNLRSLSLQAVVASEGCLRHLLGKHSQSLRSVELSNIRLHSADPPDQFGRGSWISFIQFLNETLSLDRIRFDGCFSNGWDEGWISRDADWERRVYGGDIVPPPYPDDCLKYRIGRFITHDGPCPFTARGGQSDDADYDYHQLPWVFEEDRSWHFEYRLIQ